ncbi:geranylfarnesyl diphosphate synthase [Halorussus caseinilyticus]|uniref:Geranylfarnesyl diphosphate synthase n=1 Tax=Halorussus caseinilyticus TaxID=3034025 RepID=A0ABD5WI99_9EURY|nr:polyprenyl synthetase family protein [Halorussus sp. DT72]
MKDASAEILEAQVQSAVEQRREIVNAAIGEELPVEDPERLYEAVRHLLDAGGKRLRPTVLMLIVEALADVDADPTDIDYRNFPDAHGEPLDVMSAAVSLEAIQTFTLIHDDIMDQDDLRRGVPAVHRAYDTETAILAGDTLYSKAFEILIEADAPADRVVEAMDVLATTCTDICEGQALDMAFEERTDVLPDEYLEMIEDKTAVLYGATTAIPAILFGADDETVEELYQYGIDVGRAFQIQDDILDLTVPSEELGKQRGSDLVEGKQTIITLHAREQGVDVDELVGTDDVDAVTEAEIDEAVARLEDAGSIDYAKDKANELVTSGKDHLSVLPDNEARDLLEGIADYLIERGY